MKQAHELMRVFYEAGDQEAFETVAGLNKFANTLVDLIKTPGLVDVLVANGFGGKVMEALYEIPAYVEGIEAIALKVLADLEGDEKIEALSDYSTADWLTHAGYGDVVKGIIDGLSPEDRQRIPEYIHDFFPSDKQEEVDADPWGAPTQDSATGVYSAPLPPKIKLPRPGKE